ncbi:Slx4p interacting protein [Exophiala xenobiotica]|nr:Slx4p interacting protein [Exophiala xenobiotica]KAK5549381.1 Slx4p interacting protein [Chaetothyriales sp. CCFEE 6169]KAK5382445.1 Slx4p interacting protein [Exophiala xenobiotica]KAK5396102.1 Slx4p interacting protein [Exophiala xenobiotica]KAK5461973.1 Slx4p interacting protein [Exophiala xenobiotica]
MDIKPIPAFYCCYLLRSTVRHASVYVGSSPDPARRLGQHNGRVQGGAVRTSRATLRPWEVTCIVAGFPSNIAALQFEWAWQNSHLTRHITPNDRISFAATRTKTSRSGKTTKRPGRPRTSMLDKLSNLHLLLRASYFSKWPLEVRFFNQDAYRSWETWCERVDTSISPDIKVIFDPSQTQPSQDQDEFTSAQPLQKRKKTDLIGKGGVEGVDPTYARLRGVLEKSQFLLDEDDEQKCTVCQSGIDLEKGLFVICHTNHCRAMSHVTCLADTSLKHKGSASLVPRTGYCPSCKLEHSWQDLMQQVTLRMRGLKEIKKLLGKKGKGAAATAAEILEDEGEESEADEEALTAQEVVDEELDDDQDGDDAASIASTDSYISRASEFEAEIVIEDSEDER